MHRKFVGNVVYNSVGELGSRLPFIATEIYIANLLGVQLYGFWAIIQLLVNYNNFSHFGLLSGLAKLEPVALSSNSTPVKKLEELRSNSFYPVLFIDIFILFVLILLGNRLFVVSGSLNVGELVLPLYSLLIVQQLFLYAQTRLQNIINFKLLSLGKLLYSFLFLLFVYVSSKVFLDVPKLELLVLAWFAAYGASTAFLFLRGRLLPSPVIGLSTIKLLVVTGFPIFLVGCLKLLLISLDKIFIISFYSPEEVGAYNISLQAMVLMSMVIGLLSRVFSPMFLGMASLDQSKAQHFYDFIKKLSFVGGGGCAFLGALIFTIVVRLHLVEFQEGIVPGVFLIFSGVYQGGVQLSITAVIAKNSENRLLAHFLVMGSLYALLLWGSIVFKCTLTEIALLNFIFWLVLEITICRRLLLESVLDLLFSAAFVVGPLGVVVILVVSSPPLWCSLIVVSCVLAIVGYFVCFKFFRAKSGVGGILG